MINARQLAPREWIIPAMKIASAYGFINRENTSEMIKTMEKARMRICMILICLRSRVSSEDSSALDVCSFDSALTSVMMHLAAGLEVMLFASQGKNHREDQNDGKDCKHDLEHPCSPRCIPILGRSDLFVF
jgi:hypothetical protein